MRLYRFLLHLYPASFRAEYGEQMCAVFAARQRAEGALLLWLTAILDVLSNALRCHVDLLRQDLRWTLRVLRQSPGFTFTAVTVIALGIGATTAAFTLLDHVLLRPLPFANPQQLVMLYETQAANGYARDQTSAPNFVDWRAMSKSFDSMGAVLSSLVPVNLSGPGQPRRLDSAQANSGVFQTLGVPPAAGRALTPEDDRDGAPNVVILSHDLAANLFGDFQSAVGGTLNLDSQAHTVVGVMPPNFAFPSRDVQLWKPLRFTRGLLMLRRNAILNGIARLRPGVSMEQARAEMNLIARQLERAYPKDNAGSGAAVVALRDTISSQSRTLVLAVFGAAFCLTLIACTNIASLLVARSMLRTREIAVRVAIGAARERLFRQFLTESVLLGLAGGALGLMLAVMATPLLAAFVPEALPSGATPQVDWRILAFAAAVTLLTSFAFGTGPAWLSIRGAGAKALGLRSTGAGRKGNLRGALVLAEIAGTVVLCVGTGLLLKALWRVQSVDPGFRAGGILALRTALPMPKYSADVARRGFYYRVLARARVLPGVLSAAYISHTPMDYGGNVFAVTAPGAVDDVSLAPRAVLHHTTGDYFATLGIPLLRGRDVSDRDDLTVPLVAVISDSLAQRLWPGQDPIGRHLIVARFDRTVIGVAADVAVRGPERVSEPQIYLPSEQLGTALSTLFAPKDLVIRVQSDPAALAPAVRGIIREADPEQAVTGVRLLTETVASQTMSRRAHLRVLGTFVAIAFLLAAVGIHGLLSFAVTSRTQEVGVRMALGAARGDILRMFLRQGLALCAGGVAIAVPVSYAAAQSMTSLLFGVPPSDPWIYGSAASLALVMTVAGSLLPALRAANVDPGRTIRAD